MAVFISNFLYAFQCGNNPHFQTFDHALTYPFSNLSSKYIDTPLPDIPVKSASTSEGQLIERVLFQAAYIAVHAKLIKAH